MKDFFKDLSEGTLKVLIYVCRIILCLIIVGLYCFLCFEIVSIADKLNGWLILALIVGYIAGCVASIYYLFNGYAIYIGEKILRLYNKPDGEYVIISDSKWLFWLPIFYREATDIICWRWGIKAKKNGNILELSGIKERHIPYTFPFPFRKDKDLNFFDLEREFCFTGFRCIPSERTLDYVYRSEHPEQTFDWIFFTRYNDVWLFKLIGKKGCDNPNEYNEIQQAYENASERSHEHLMGIFFDGVNYNEDEKNKQTQIIKLNKKNPVLKSAVEYKLPKKYKLPIKTIVLLTFVIFITFGLFLYRTIDYQNYFSDRVPLYRHIIDFGSTISDAITDYTEAYVYEKLFNRGNAYFKESNYDQAIEDYTATLRIKPDLHAALYNRGLAYWNKGNYHRATEDFEAVLKIDPNNVKAKENLEKISQIYMILETK
ncbi:MAG: tetratricopeptide repeat protein [Fibromonadaceae bacterium]|jgi:tetratricopeptide (TPR) repeat protein|nr:tetratricopeptide repeat protein [Fibromonadaceae bacterium]